MIRSGSFWLGSLLALLFVVATGCDSSEDPALLDLNQQDSSGVRVVNLLADEPVTVTLAGTTITTGLGTFGVSEYRNFLTTERVSLLVRRSRVDTLRDQNLTSGSRTTYFITGTRDTTIIVPRSTSTIEQDDLRDRRMARLVFINAVGDTTSYHVRAGCPGGDTIFSTSRLGNALFSDLAPSDISVYLVPSDGGPVVASARVTLAAGGTYYLIAAASGGSPGFFLLTPTATTLSPAPVETRAQASVQLMNALTDGPASATLGSRQIGTDIAPLALSSPVDVDACGSAGGDTLQVTTSMGSSIPGDAPLQRGEPLDDHRLSIPRRDQDALAAARQPAGERRQGLSARRQSCHLAPRRIDRGRGRSSRFGSARDPAVRPASARLRDGIPRAPRGTLSSARQGCRQRELRDGGVGTLAPGFYTLFIVDRGGAVGLMLGRDDAQPSTLEQFGEIGTQVRLFNMMPDADAEFTAGGLTLAALPYSYVRSTLFPATLTPVTSNAGSITVDLSAGSYTIGATGSAGNRSLIALPSISAPPSPTKASVRFLNAVPGSPELVVHSASNTGPELARTSFATVSASVDLDERRYAFVVTSASDTTTLAYADGLELTEGRRYLFVVGLKRNGSSSPLPYEVLWMQE